MINTAIQLLPTATLLVLLYAIFMHIARRNSSQITLYAIQSAFIAALLIIIGLHQSSFNLLTLGLLTILVKVVAALIFFTKLIGPKRLSTSATAYLNLPVTLGIILALVVLAKSAVFLPIISFFPENSGMISFSLAGIFTSLFLVVNRRGIFSQLIGILSFENCLVAFGLSAGIEHTLIVEIGILFDLLLWMVISSVLVKLIYTHFGSLDTKELNQLKD